MTGRRALLLTLLAAVVAAAVVVPLAVVGNSSPRRAAARHLTPPTSSTTVPTTSTTLPGTSTTTAPSLPTVWTTRTVPAGVAGPLTAVTCPTASRCYAVGGTRNDSASASIVTSADGGNTWELTYSAPKSFLSGIACAGATRCVAVGGTSALTEVPLVVVTADGGHQWSQEALPEQVGDLSQVACASATTCVAAGLLNGAAVGVSTVAGGPTIVRTTDGGTAWTLGSVPAGLTFITTISCPASSLCIVGGSGPGPTASSPSVASMSTNGGETWTSPSVVEHPSGFGDIVCIDARTCAGSLYSGATTSTGQGQAVVTSDGGTAWTVLSTGIGDAVSCTETMCLSAGGLPHRTTPQRPVWYTTAFVSTDGGQSWSPVSMPAYQGVLYGVHCDASDNCVVVGGGTDGSLATSPAMILTYGH
jgi:hypothetical protein